MRYILLALCLSLLIGGCNIAKRESIIPEDKLTKILVDIHIADGTLASKGYRVKQDSLLLCQYYDYIFVKYETTPITFKATLDYYSKDPEKFEEIYVKVLEQLTILEGQINEEPLAK